MESETWGWLLLGIGVGYGLGNRQSTKFKKTKEPLTTLKIPVTRFKNTSTGGLSDYDESSNMSTVFFGNNYELSFYNKYGAQQYPYEIQNFVPSDEGITLDDTNISNINIQASQSKIPYSVYIKFKDSSDISHEGIFLINVI